MSWRPAIVSDLPHVEDLIRQNELTAASLSSRLKGRTDSRHLELPKRTTGELLVHESKGIDALLYLERNGFSFPLFTPEYLRTGSSADLSLRAVLKPLGRQLFSCMGSRKDVEHFISLLDPKPYHRVEYAVMSRGRKQPHAPLAYNGDLRIETAVPADLPRLLPLQLGYEREEVLIPGKTINEAYTRRQLIESIQSQRIIYATYRGHIVAKAQTNAIGLQVEQLGGIFTLPEYRGRGIGTALVESISRMIIADGRVVCLFVKTDNRAAKRVYEKCGFLMGPAFTIAYF
jgi:predicted GNAT family acetyltransferase